jgi:hypothetical protein
MTDEPAANPAVSDADAIVTHTDPLEANTPAVGDTTTQTPQTTEAAEVDELDKLAGIDTANPEPEPVEVEYEGKQYKLPPELKDAVLRQADYTRKTMEVAEARKAVETEREQIQALATRSQEEFQAHVTFTQLDAAVKQYETIDWQAWAQTDPNAANAARWERDDLIRQRDQIGSALTQHLQQKARQQSDEIASQRQQAFETVAKELPNFNEVRRQELETTLETDFGAPKGIGSKITDAWEYRILHYADIGKKFIERQRQAAQAARAQAGKPAAQVNGSADAGKSPESMSMDEYKAWRATQ